MPSFWFPDSWSDRLAELETTDFEGKQAPLRRDVRSLGALLGQVLFEQAGDDLFQTVETLRRTAIARREAEAAGDQPTAEQHLNEALTLTRAAVADPAEAYKLARAFAFYFELINLAETNHRKRRRRASSLGGSAAASSLSSLPLHTAANATADRPASGERVQRGSFRGTVRRLREAGIRASLCWLCWRRFPSRPCSRRIPPRSPAAA